MSRFVNPSVGLILGPPAPHTWGVLKQYRCIDFQNPPRVGGRGAFAACLLALATLFFASLPAHADGTVVVGSKKFTESYVLAEIAKKSLTDAGFTVEHRQGIGATGIVWEALKTGAIQVYPEYTGTIGEEILKAKAPLTADAMRTQLAGYGVGMGGDLGFDDTYALVMRKDQAAQLGIKTIDDLAKHTDLRLSLSNEFIGRKDGWKPLSEKYGLTVMQPKGIEHGLAYKALASNQIDVTDAYSTDAGIATNDLVVLDDNQHFFPQYKAVFLYRLDLAPGALAALKKIEGTIDDTRMTRLNADAEKTKNYALAAASYFGTAARANSGNAPGIVRASACRLDPAAPLSGRRLAASPPFVVGIPLGIAASRGGFVGAAILSITGVIQTIPSLALLALLVPLLGISPNTAIVALFLYSLLPIVRNTATGLAGHPRRRPRIRRCPGPDARCAAHEDLPADGVPLDPLRASRPAPSSMSALPPSPP